MIASCTASGVRSLVARVVEVDPQSDPRWETFIAGHPDALVYHHPAWLRVLELEYGRKTLNLACEDEAGNICAILPLLVTRGLPFFRRNGLVGRRLSSLPRTPLAGPLAKHPHALTTILKAAVEYVRSRPGLQLQLKLVNSDLEELAEGLVFVPWRVSYVLTLPDRSENLHFGDSRNHGRIKWEVRAAARRGIVVRVAETEADLRAWYPLYLETMRWHAVPARSFRFFRSVWELLRPRGLMRLLLAELYCPAGTRIVAGSMFLRFGRTVFYSFNGVHRQDFPLRPNDIIQWHAIHQACAEGFHFFDLGEVSAGQDGLAKFKSKWGANAICLYHALCPAPEQTGMAEMRATHLCRSVTAIWRVLPLEATARIGDLINSFL